MQMKNEEVVKQDFRHATRIQDELAIKGFLQVAFCGTLPWRAWLACLFKDVKSWNFRQKQQLENCRTLLIAPESTMGKLLLSLHKICIIIYTHIWYTHVFFKLVQSSFWVSSLISCLISSLLPFVLGEMGGSTSAGVPIHLSLAGRDGSATRTWQDD